MGTRNYDKTSQVEVEEKTPAIHTAVASDSSSSEVETPYVRKRGFLGYLCHCEAVLDRKFGIEAFGPERILPEDRKAEYQKWSNQAVMALLWASGTMNLSCE